MVGSVVVERIIEKGAENVNIGFDAYHGKYVDMFAAGIVDPTKVYLSIFNGAKGSWLKSIHSFVMSVCFETRFFISFANRGFIAFRTVAT